MKTYKIFWLILFIVISLALAKCRKDDITLALVKTYSPLYVASTMATVGLTVESNGGSDIICGIYMGIEANPEATGTQFQIANDTGLFLGQVTGLLPETQYYLKAYAKNSKGESLGDQVNFTTPGTIVDYDDNVYETVNIGNQSWMAENLRTTHYLNGDMITTTNPSSLDITTEDSPKYQWSYNDSEANSLIYGNLYTWYTITDSRKVCPAGWHIPGDSEWTALENALGGYIIAGSKLKEAKNAHWLSPYNVDATNESCFSGLPGGYRSWDGSFFMINNNGHWWSSTESENLRSWIRKLETASPAISRADIIKSFGASVRCIKDN